MKVIIDGIEYVPKSEEIKLYEEVKRLRLIDEVNKECIRKRLDECIDLIDNSGICLYFPGFDEKLLSKLAKIRIVCNEQIKWKINRENLIVSKR